jgi:hypothetical protein
VQAPGDTRSAALYFVQRRNGMRLSWSALCVHTRAPAEATADEAGKLARLVGRRLDPCTPIIYSKSHGAAVAAGRHLKTMSLPVPVSNPVLVTFTT